MAGVAARRCGWSAEKTSGERIEGVSSRRAAVPRTGQRAWGSARRRVCCGGGKRDWLQATREGEYDGNGQWLRPDVARPGRVARAFDGCAFRDAACANGGQITRGVQGIVRRRRRYRQRLHRARNQRYAYA